MNTQPKPRRADYDTPWFRQARADFKRKGRATDAPCWICHQPIDYDAPKGDPNSHTLDHYYPFANHPELHDDPANWRHAHMRCNSRRGKRSATRHDNPIHEFWT